MKSPKEIETLDRHLTSRLERLREDYFRTLNPIYAWEAVTACNTHDHQPRPLPQWCLDYVVTVANSMWTLGQLNNPKTYPYQNDGEPDDDYLDRHSAWQATSITPAQANAMLPWALRVTRPGWNAFARYAAEFDDRMLATWYYLSRPEQKPKVLASIGKKKNIDAQSVRRRIAKGWRREQANSRS